MDFAPQVDDDCMEAYMKQGIKARLFISYSMSDEHLEHLVMPEVQWKCGMQY